MAAKSLPSGRAYSKLMVDNVCISWNASIK
jgi:hypothetical protein